MTTTLIAIAVVAILAVLLSGWLFLQWEDEKTNHSLTRAELAMETIQHTGTKQRLAKTEQGVVSLSGAVAPLMTKTAWSMGGVSISEMRSAEVSRNSAADRARKIFMSIPVVEDEGRRLAREGKMFGRS